MFHVQQNIQSSNMSLIIKAMTIDSKQSVNKTDGLQMKINIILNIIR